MPQGDLLPLQRSQDFVLVVLPYVVNSLKLGPDLLFRRRDQGGDGGADAVLFLYVF